jgi:tetratricopeptide (TPR) repeat protein
LGRFDDAERWKNLSQSFLKRLGPGQERTEAWLDQGWGLTEQRAGRHEQAVESIRRAIALKERALPADHPDIGISWMGLAELLSEGGDYANALGAIEKALSLFQKTYGAASVPAGDAIGIRGEVLAGLGRFSEAEKDDRECLAQREAVEPNRAWVAYPLTALGKVLVAEGRVPEAVSALERARRIRESSESNAALVAETEFALARALRVSGRELARARFLAQRALSRYRGLPAQSKQVVEVESWLAEWPREGKGLEAASGRFESSVTSSISPPENDQARQEHEVAR